jgi:hypothetical protein
MQDRCQHVSNRIGYRGAGEESGGRCSNNGQFAARLGKERVFFFEKKNQKTFVLLRTLPARYTPMVKSLLLLFFRKEGLPS